MIFGDLQDDAKEFFIQAKEAQQNQYDDPSLGSTSTTASFSSTSFSCATHAEQRMIQRLLQTKNSRESGSSGPEQAAFEWSSSYFLRLERLPDSHISAQLATKILFAGKAVLMLQQSQFHQNTVQREEIFTHRRVDQRSCFQYLSQGNSFFQSSSGTEEKKKKRRNDSSGDEEDEDANSTEEEEDTTTTSDEEEEEASKAIKKKKKGTKTNRDETKTSSQKLIIGFTREEIDSFDKQFHNLLCSSSSQLVPQLEVLINSIYDLISNRLWNFMKESYGFLHYLQIIRNTYLMGKGEFFQNILDELYVLTFDASYLPKLSSQVTAGGLSSPSPTPAASSSTLEEIDEILNWKILRNSTKLIGLDDDEMIHILSLKTDLNSIVINKFTEQNIHYFTMNGFAQCEYPEEQAEKGKKHPSSFTSENIYEPLNILFNTRSAPKLSNLFMKLWQEKNSLQSIYLYNTMSNPWNPLHQQVLSPQVLAMKQVQIVEPTYLNGSLWFNDTKFVQKGFYQTINFAPSWININRYLMMSHPYFQSTSVTNKKNWPRFTSNDPKHDIMDRRQADLLLGSIATCLQNDPRNIHSQGKGELSRDIQSSILVGVSFHGKFPVHSILSFQISY
jgi:hypothetical protein